MVRAVIYSCTNGAGWHPTLHTKDDHHHPPQSWRRNILAQEPNAAQAWWRIIPLCGICHGEYHTLLNLYVRVGDIPPYAERRTYSPFIRVLVAEAWDRRPGGKLPYTLTTDQPGGTHD